MSRKLKPAMFLYLAAMVTIHAVIFWNERDLIRKGYSDFASYYSAGTIVGEGMGHRLYDPGLQYFVQRRFAPDVAIRAGALPYTHPPFEALFFAPLTRLSYLSAFVLWDVLNLLVLLALYFLLRQYLPRISAPACLLASLGFFPVLIALLQGQDVIFVLLLFALVFRALNRSADFAAGCWLGLGLFRFQLVVPFALILLLRRRARAIAGFSIVGVALALISAAILGWRNMLAYPAYLLHLEDALGNGAILPADMPNLRGLLTAVLGTHVPKMITTGLVVLASLGLIVLASAKWRIAELKSLPDLGFSLALVVTVLASYHGLAHDLTLLLLPIMLLANRFLEGDMPPDGAWVGLFGPIFVLFLSPFEMLLAFRYRQLNLLALILLLWVWGISREISRHAPLSMTPKSG